MSAMHIQLSLNNDGREEEMHTSMFFVFEGSGVMCSYVGSKYFLMK